MRIALCFSGQMRDLNETKEFWTSLIKKYDMDVYASFWDIERPEIGDTIKEFEKVTGEKVKYEVAPRRAGDPPTTYADITKAKTAFGWEPIYDIADIVKHAYDWELKQQKKKR